MEAKFLCLSFNFPARPFSKFQLCDDEKITAHWKMKFVTFHLIFSQLLLKNMSHQAVFGYFQKKFAPHCTRIQLKLNNVSRNWLLDGKHEGVNNNFIKTNIQ